MDKRTSGKGNALKRYAVCAAALASTFVLAAALGIFSAKKGIETARILSDSCFFGGALCLGTAGLIYAGGHGLFDGIAYAVKLFFARTLFRKSCKVPESYAEFCEKRKKTSPVFLGSFAAIGCVLFALAAIFLLSFFNIRT